MKKRVSSYLPELTTNQIQDLKDFYKRPEVLGSDFCTSRILIICVNYFWKHIFEEEHEFNKK